MRRTRIFAWAPRFAPLPDEFLADATLRTPLTASPFVPNASPSSKLSAKASAASTPFRGDGYRYSYTSLWRLPPVDLGILRRCPRNHGEPQGQDRNHSDERSLPQTIRFLQPIR